MLRGGMAFSISVHNCEISGDSTTDVMSSRGGRLLCDAVRHHKHRDYTHGRCRA